MCFVVWINIWKIQWEQVTENVRFNLVHFNQTSKWWKDFCKSFPMHNSSLTHNILNIIMSSLATSAFAIENKAFNIHLLFKFPIHLEILISTSFYTFSVSWKGIILSLRLVWPVLLAQVLLRPQLTFPSKTWFFGIYLNFQQQKSLKNQYLPDSESKSYQINSIKSCSSRSFQ